MRMTEKTKKLARKVVSGVLAFAMTCSLAASMPEMSLVGSADNVSEASSVTQDILKLFGTLQDSSSTSEYSAINTNNLSAATDSYYKYYGSNYADGYNFTMSRFSIADQTLTITYNGDEYSNSGSSSKTALAKASSHTYIQKFDSSNAYKDDYSASTSKTYVGSVGDYEADGTVSSTDSDMGTAYGILLKDSTYNTSSKASAGNISYRYENVGSYTDENGKIYDIDVELVIDNYSVHDDYVAIGQNSQFQNRWSVMTTAQYNKLNSTQKALCTYLTSAQQARANALWQNNLEGGSAYSYGITYAVPTYNYTAFYNAGGWKDLASIKGYKNYNNYYSTNYGAVLTFTTDHVGIAVEWVDWVKVKYYFYKAGTDTKITVKGQALWKDIDYSQGITFYNDHISTTNSSYQADSGTIYPATWRSENNLYKGSFSNYTGFFDYRYHETDTSDTKAWAAASFNTNYFCMVYSFCGPYKSGGTTNANSTYTTSSNYNATTTLAVHGISGGMIQSDNPDLNNTGTVRILKKFTVDGGSALITTNTAVSKGYVSTQAVTTSRNAYITNISYKLKNDDGDYIVAKKDGLWTWTYTGTSSTGGTTFYLTYSDSAKDYRVVINGVPVDAKLKAVESINTSITNNVTGEYDGTKTGIASGDSWSDAYNTSVKQGTTSNAATLSYSTDPKVTYNSTSKKFEYTKGTANLVIDFTNNYITDASKTGTVRILKKFTINGGSDLISTVDAVADKYVTETNATTSRNAYISNIYYYIKDSNGNYVTASQNGLWGYTYTGTSSSSGTKFYLTSSDSANSDYRVVLSGVPVGKKLYAVENITSSYNSVGVYNGTKTGIASGQKWDSAYGNSTTSSKTSNQATLAFSTQPTVTYDSSTKLFVYTKGEANLVIDYINNIDTFATLKVSKYIKNGSSYSKVASTPQANYVSFAVQDRQTGKWVSNTTNGYTSQASTPTYYALKDFSSSNYEITFSGLDPTHPYQIYEVVTTNDYYKTSMVDYKTSSSWITYSGTNTPNITVTRGSTKTVQIANPKVPNNKINIYKAVSGYTSNGTTSQTLLWNSESSITNMYNSQKTQVMSSKDDAEKLYYYVKNSSGQYLTFKATNLLKYEFKYVGTSSTLSGTAGYTSTGCKIYFDESMYGTNGGAATLTYLPDGTYYVYEVYAGDCLLSSVPASYTVTTTGASTDGGTTYTSTSGASVSNLTGSTTKYVTFTNTVQDETGFLITKYVTMGNTSTQMTNSATFGAAIAQLRFYLTYVDKNGNEYLLSYSTASGSGNSAGNYTFKADLMAYQNIDVSYGGTGKTSNYGGRSALMQLDDSGQIKISFDESSLASAQLQEYIDKGSFHLHEVYYPAGTIVGTSDYTASNKGTQNINNVIIATEVEDPNFSGTYGLANMAAEDETPILDLAKAKLVTVDISNPGPVSLTFAKYINTLEETVDESTGDVSVNSRMHVLATQDNYPDVIDSLRYYVQCTSGSYSGKYYKVKYDTSTERYTLNGFSDTLTDDCYIKLNENGYVTVDSTVRFYYGTYHWDGGYYFDYSTTAQIYETFVDTDDYTAEQMCARFSYTSYNPSSVTFSDYTNGIVSFSMTNNQTDRPLQIIKNIEGTEALHTDSTQEAIGSVAYYPEILDSLRFYIKSISTGKYLMFDDNDFIGSSSTLVDDCYLTLDDNGSLMVYHLPDDSSLVVYEVCNDDSVKALISTDVIQSVGPLTTNSIGTVYGSKGFLYTTATITDTPTTGKITVQKTTNLEGDEKVDLEGIEFEISGTSTLGFLVDEIITTDENGYAETGDIYVGTYQITELTETIPDGLSAGGLVVNEKILIDNDGYYVDYEGNKYAGDEDNNLLVDDQTGEYTYALAGDDDYYAKAVYGVAVTTDTTASYTYYNYKSYMDVNLQKVTNADDVDNPITDLSGITFTISGTSYVGIEVNESVTTGTDGLAEFEHLPSGVYTVTEDLGSRADDFAGYADVGINGGQTWTITLDDENNGQTLDYEYWNYYTEINLTKVDNRGEAVGNYGDPIYFPISGATFSVFSDVDGDGEYDDSVDELLYYIDMDGNGLFESQYDEVLTETDAKLLIDKEPDTYEDIIHELTLVEDPDDPGYYSIEGLTFGTYFIKETALSDEDIRWVLDDTYYAVTISAEETIISVINNEDETAETGYAFGFYEPYIPTQSITLTKRIKVDEIDGSIWYEHGTPTFVLELTNTDDDITYRHSYEFTEDYVNANKFEENGVEYVEMSYTWTELPAAHYTATELNTTRYTLEDIINISDTGTKVEQTKTDDNVNTIWAVEFEAVADSESYATFYNVKNTYKDLSDNCIVVNDII